MGTVKLHNGCQAYIMTPQQWAKYNYDYNALNNIAQPQNLIDEMDRLEKERRRQEYRRMVAMEQLEYDLSFMGNTGKRLTQYYLKIFLPLTLLVVLVESMQNSEWYTTYSWWKQTLTIPDTQDFLNFEVPVTASHQSEIGEQKNAEISRERMRRIKEAEATGDARKIKEAEEYKEPEA